MIIEWPPLAGVEAVLDEAASAVAAAAATRHSCAKKEKEEAIRGGFWPRLALASTLSDPAAGRAAQEPRHVPSRAPSDAPSLVRFGIRAPPAKHRMSSRARFQRRRGGEAVRATHGKHWRAPGAPREERSSPRSPEEQTVMKL